MRDGPHRTETRLDWDRFVRLHWDRHPVVFRDIGPPVYPADAVLRAVARARPRDDDDVPTLRFVLDGRQLAAPGPWLPDPHDIDFDAYARRVRERAGDACEYALIVNTLHRHGYGVWAAGQRFFQGLWQRVGIPGSSAITTLFHGNYERTPVGVHKDRFATFLFVLEGRKRMRFWPQRPWSAPVATCVDYAEYMGSSFAIDVEPGDVLYWPADYYHVGETAGVGQATSVNVGVPRHEHRLAYDLDAVLPLAPEACKDAFRADPASMFASERTVLPDAMRQALQATRAEFEIRRLAAGARRWRLQLATAGGFVPPPPLVTAAPAAATGNAHRCAGDRTGRSAIGESSVGGGPDRDGECRHLRLRDDATPLVWDRDEAGPGGLCAAGGHVRRFEDGTEIGRLVDRLNAGARVAVEDLPDLRDWLLATRIVRRVA